jgi:hypothetical protein
MRSKAVTAAQRRARCRVDSVGKEETLP